MHKTYTPPPDQQTFRADYKPGRQRFDLDNPHEPYRANFSGWTCPSGQTAANVIDYYLHGGNGGNPAFPPMTTPEDLEHRRDIGCPISGDETTRMRHWQETRTWPTIHEIWEHLRLTPDHATPKPAPVAAPELPGQTSIFEELDA